MGFWRCLDYLIFGKPDKHGKNALPDGDSTPPPLPRTRPRALSLPDKQPHQQLQSPLFKLLSAELRNRIYELVLADGHYEEGRELHLTSMHRRLACIRCFDDDPNPPYWNHQCWGWWWMDGTHRGPLEGQPPDTSLLSLLLACRRTYVTFFEPHLQYTLTGHRYIEAVDILYSQNKFVVRLLKTVVDLQRTVLPHRLNLIRFLRIEVRFHFPVPLEVINDSKSHSRLPTDVGEMWLPTCRAISLMHGLHELHITVDDAWQDRESGKAEAMYAQFLQPLMDVVVPVFQVEIHPLFDVEMVLRNLVRTPPFSLRPRTTQLWPKST